MFSCMFFDSLVHCAQVINPMGRDNANSKTDYGCRDISYDPDDKRAAEYLVKIPHYSLRAPRPHPL